MLALIYNGEIVKEVEDGSAFTHGGAVTAPAYSGWENDDGYRLATIAEAAPVPAGKRVVSVACVVVNGAPTYVNALEDVPAPSVDDYKRAIEQLLNEKAQERRYDSAVSIATYITSTNPQWAAEAGAFVAWRDAIWTYAYTEMNKVQIGQRNQPKVAEFLAELPQVSWPA